MLPSEHRWPASSFERLGRNRSRRRTQYDTNDLNRSSSPRRIHDMTEASHRPSRLLADAPLPTREAGPREGLAPLRLLAINNALSAHL